MAKDLGINAKVGLDGSGFQEGIGKINQQLKLVQAQFREAGSRVADFGNSSERVEILTRQLEIQKQAVSTLESAYQRSVQTKGADASATQNLEIRLTNARTALNRMDSELNAGSVDIERQESLWTRLGRSTESASSQAQGHILNLKNTLLGLTATLAGGAGLFKFTESAIDAGDATYKLSQKLHVSSQEAAAVNKILKVTDTDSSAFISTLTKMDKGVETAGKNGNATTKALTEFGISLTDAHGKLLPMPEQMDKLAAAYKKAAEAGNEEAFTAEVLGNKGQALIPLLEDYTDAKEVASKVKGIGVDPQQAHETEMALKALKMQVSALSGVFAKSLIPVVQQVIPPLMEGFTKLTEVIKTHKAELDKVIQSFIQMGKQIGSAVLPIIKNVFNFVVEHGTLVKNTVIGIGIAFATFKTITTTINAIRTAQEIWAKVTAEDSIAMKALNLVMEMNPIGLVVIAVAALVAGLVLLFQHNKQFHDFVVNSFPVIKQVIGDAINSVVGILKGLGDSLLAVWNIMKPTLVDGVKEIQTYWNQVWPEIKQVFSEIWTAMKVLFTPIIAFFYVTISAQLGLIKGIWGSAWNLIKDTFKFIWDEITGYLKIVWDLISGIIKVALDLLTGNFKGAGKDFLSIFTNIGNDIKNLFSNLANDALTWGADLINGLINGIKGAIGGLVSAVSNVANTIWSHLHFSVPEEGPLTDYESWMPDFMGGLAKGINDSKHLVANAIKSVSMDMNLSTQVAGGYGGSSNITKNNSTQNIFNITLDAKNMSDLNKAMDTLSGLQQAMRAKR